jgi:hypothetical protein
MAEPGVDMGVEETEREIAKIPVSMNWASRWQDENACTTPRLREFSTGAYTGQDSPEEPDLQ